MEYLWTCEVWPPVSVGKNEVPTTACRVEWGLVEYIATYIRRSLGVLVCVSDFTFLFYPNSTLGCLVRVLRTLPNSTLAHGHAQSDNG